ncbi:hypothetical protein QZH41_019776 [Actinostola sp. cb2023]|nr:hypothetical protein QZH41_019776 [Actinostola sp. cb2023]
MEASSTSERVGSTDTKPLVSEEVEEEEHECCVAGDGDEEKAESAPQSTKKKRRRRRRSRKESTDKQESEKDQDDEFFEEAKLEKENVRKARPKSAVERIEVKMNKEIEKSTSHDDKEHDENEQDGERPGSHKHRHRRNRKKKNDTADGESPQKEENVAAQSPNKTPVNTRQSTPRKWDNSAKSHSPHHNKKVYEKYWSLEKVSEGLKRRELLKGSIRISRKNYELAWVSVEGMRRDVVLEGMVARNRALEGDIVTLQICARDKWKVMKAELEEHQARSKQEEKKEDIDVLTDALNATSLSPSQASPKLNTPEKLRKADVPDEFLQQTATVVYIIEKKHSRAAGGHLKPFNTKNKGDADGLFTPTDSRLPRLRIPQELCPPGFFDRPQDFANSLFVARITDWPERSSFDNFMAIGSIMRSLGEAGEIMPETEAIFTEYEIDFGPFPEEALACLPKTPWVIPEEELAKRRDFRDECVFTIDPLTARDLDDALHCKRLPDGNIEVGVHIADVSYFVRQGTVLDDVAQTRATSTYMVQTVVPMLPRLLCEELCSLNPDEDRLTVSVVWTMNDKGEILSDWKGRSVIRSRVKLAYEHAHDMIQNPNKKWEEGELPPISQGTDASEIASKVLLLHKIAVHLRRNRFDNGALRLDQVKLQFDLDKETGMPDGYHVHQQRDSNKMIEEFMLLANMAIAHHIYTAFPSIALLRRHPKPDQRQLDELVKLCHNHGIQFNIQSSKTIQQSLAKFPLGSPKREILVLYTMKPMKNALYFCSGSMEEERFGHYALSVPFYTHFTSPIRRFPDIIVHRLLTASLGLDEKVDEQKYNMDIIAQHCNDRKAAAKHAGELSSELFFAIFVRECGPLEDKGFVSAIMDQSFDVFIPALGVTKRIYCKFCASLKRFQLLKDQENRVASIKLTWRAESGPDIEQTLTTFSKVDVALTTENQVAEKDEKKEKNKRVKVYARLVPPPGAARPPKHTTALSSHVLPSPVASDGVRKTLFADGSKDADNSDDDVIIEEEEMVDDQPHKK